MSFFDSPSPVSPDITAPGLPKRPTPNAPADATPSIPLAGGAGPGAGGPPPIPTPTRPNDATPSIPLAGAGMMSQAGPGAPPSSPTTPTPGAGGMPNAPVPALAPTPVAAPAAGAGAAANSIPLAGSTTAPGANFATNTPGGAADYTNKTIAPGAGVDRVKLANDVFESSAKASDPYYQKTLRDATNAAGPNGQLGSGQLRTSLGDAGNLRATQLDSLRSGLMHDATSGSIEDQYRNIDIARQQQGFQAGRQDTAFNQAAQQQQIEEALRSGDFSRAAQMLALGNAGNPSDTALTLANSYGQQAGAAGTAVSNLVGNSVRNNATQTPDWMQQLLAGYGGNNAPAPASGLPPIAQTPTQVPGSPPADWNYHGPVRQPAYPGALPLAGGH